MMAPDSRDSMGSCNDNHFSLVSTAGSLHINIISKDKLKCIHFDDTTAQVCENRFVRYYKSDHKFVMLFCISSAILMIDNQEALLPNCRQILSKTAS